MRKPLTSGQKGAQGEKQVARHLRWLSKKQYIVLSDLMLLQGRRLTQIDHVVVSVYGIFVIETKNYHGTITGTERKEFWTQERHGKRYNFRSPFRQNYAHIRALMQLLGLDEDCFFSIAAFADDAVLAVEQEEDSVEQLCISGKSGAPFAVSGRCCWHGTMCAIMPGQFSAPIWTRPRRDRRTWSRSTTRSPTGTLPCGTACVHAAAESWCCATVHTAISTGAAIIRRAATPWKTRHKTASHSAKMGMHTSNFLHSFELRTEENKVVLFFEMKYEKTLAFSSRMCYTTKVHKSYLIYAIKRVRHSGVCRRKVGAAFFY